MIQIFLADGTDGTDERTDQPKVVQEVLADLKTLRVENALFEQQMGQRVGGVPDIPKKEKSK